MQNYLANSAAARIWTATTHRRSSLMSSLSTSIIRKVAVSSPPVPSFSVTVRERYCNQRAATGTEAACPVPFRQVRGRSHFTHPRTRSPTNINKMIESAEVRTEDRNIPRNLRCRAHLSLLRNSMGVTQLSQAGLCQFRKNLLSRCEKWSSRKLWRITRPSAYQVTSRSPRKSRYLQLGVFAVRKRNPIEKKYCSRKKTNKQGWCQDSEKLKSSLIKTTNTPNKSSSSINTSSSLMRARR